VHPDYQQKVVWTRMIEWGLMQADVQGKRVYAQAGLIEKAMYEEFGFVVKKVVKLPNELSEGERKDEYMRYLMLRPAKVQKTE
jgi:N-acetylglutamate synthase-like GNAT family acetyltransferase